MAYPNECYSTRGVLGIIWLLQEIHQKLCQYCWTIDQTVAKRFVSLVRRASTGLRMFETCLGYSPHIAFA